MSDLYRYLRPNPLAELTPQSRAQTAVVAQSGNTRLERKRQLAGFPTAGGSRGSYEVEREFSEEEGRNQAIEGIARAGARNLTVHR